MGQNTATLVASMLDTSSGVVDYSTQELWLKYHLYNQVATNIPMHCTTIDGISGVYTGQNSMWPRTTANASAINWYSKLMKKHGMAINQFTIPPIIIGRNFIAPPEMNNHKP